MSALNGNGAEQILIDNATDIIISRQNNRGMTRSRSGILKSSIDLVNPYRVTFGVHSGIDYTSIKDVLPGMIINSGGYSSRLHIGNTTGSAYLTAYQGDLTTAQIANITINSTSGKTIFINTTSTTGSGNIFKAGDYIQPKGNTDGYNYPYTVTSNVPWSSGNVTVPVHRGIINQQNVPVAGSGIRVGNDVFFILRHNEFLSYTLLPNNKIAFEEIEMTERIKL